MSINKIEISNFKSFYKASTAFGKFNVVVGANASGKSNFVQFFKFIKDINQFGMDDAISMQGGAEYLFNANHPSDRVLSGRIVNETQKVFLGNEEIGTGFEISQNSYEIDIRASNHRTYVQSVSDRLVNDCRFFKYRKSDEDKYEELESLGPGKVRIVNVNGVMSLDINAPESVDTSDLTDSIFDLRIIRDMLGGRRARLARRESLLHISPPWVLFGFDLIERINDIGIFDIDAKITKKAQPVTGRRDLEADGSNLAAVVRRLSRNNTTRRQMANIIKSLLPFIEAISVKKLEDNVIIRIREKFESANLFPAFLLSDGTLNLTALCVVLFFENKALKIIEEPERNVHPHLISKIMGLMRDASEESQILTTTHNPEMVKHARVDELILVSRNSLGDSVLSRPGEQKGIREFLSETLGIDELYVQNILEKYQNREDA